MWKGRTIRKIVAVVLAVLMTGMLLTACTENKNGQQDAADAEDYIKVGIVIPQTGVLTAFGAGTEEMTQYALDQINEAGGLEVDGTVKKLKLFVGDSQSEPEKARQVAQQMISDQNVDVMLTSHTADTTGRFRKLVRKQEFCACLWIRRMKHGRHRTISTAIMRDLIQRTNCSVFWMHGKQQV